MRTFMRTCALMIGILLFSSLWTSSLYGATKKSTSKSPATKTSPGKRPIVLKTSDEDIAISLLARTFERMGEKDLAKRLITDYTQTKRVVFKNLGDVNAEVGRNWKGENVMTLNKSIAKQIASMKRLWDKEPFHISLNLVSRALTVYHEYIHMDQDNPKWEPKYEDPAWQATDKAITRWYNRLEKEYEDLRNEPPNQERLAKLKELSNLLRQIAEQIGPMEEGIASNINDKALSPNLTWEYPDTCAKASLLAKQIGEEVKNLEKILTSQQPISGVWRLTKKRVFYGDNDGKLRSVPLENPTKINYKQTYIKSYSPRYLVTINTVASVSEGSCTHKTTKIGILEGLETKEEKVIYIVTNEFKWTSLPEQLKPGDALKLNCSFSWNEEIANENTPQLLFYNILVSSWPSKDIDQSPYANSKYWIEQNDSFKYEESGQGPSKGNKSQEVVLKVPPRKNPNEVLRITIQLTDGSTDLHPIVEYIYEFIE